MLTCTNLSAQLLKEGGRCGRTVVESETGLGGLQAYLGIDEKVEQYHNFSVAHILNSCTVSIRQKGEHLLLVGLR